MTVGKPNAPISPDGEHGIVIETQNEESSP